MYPLTADGLVACYVAGLPFLGYTLLGDLGFTAAVFAAEAGLTRTGRRAGRGGSAGMKYAAIIEYLQDTDDGRAACGRSTGPVSGDR